MGPGGRQGQGEIKGTSRDGHWDGNRDAETVIGTEMERQGCGEERRGDSET